MITGGSCEERKRTTEEIIKEGKKDLSNCDEGIVCIFVTLPLLILH